MGSYWADSREEDLSQGDLITDAGIGSQVSPRVALATAGTAKGGVKVWNESPFTLNKDGFGHFLGRARPAPCIVLSQSCEIDKKGGKAPVLIAPVVALANIPDETLREQYRSGGRYAFFPLPAFEQVIPESYVDLRAISFAPRAVLDGLTRHASASTAGISALTAHLVAFFTRVDLEQIVTAAKTK